MLVVVVSEIEGVDLSVEGVISDGLFLQASDVVIDHFELATVSLFDFEANDAAVDGAQHCRFVGCDYG